jgi:hypothetical protein
VTLKIYGVDMTLYIAFRGVKWQRSDVDASGSGRALDGSLIRSRVATKVRIDVTCVPLLTRDAQKVLSAIMPEWVEVTYTDPQQGRDVTKTMYSNNNPASFMLRKPNGQEYWDGISFPLIEK